MQNSVKSTTELFEFKLRHSKNTVNALRENYWLTLAVVLYVIEKVNSSAL